MRVENEDYFLDPPPGSAAERAVELGIDLTLTLENLRLTPEERIRQLDDHLDGIAELKANAQSSSPTSPITAWTQAPKGAIGRQLKWLAEAGIDCVIVDDLAGALQGSSSLTRLLAVCYLRNAPNVLRLGNALTSVHARPRGTADAFSFHWDAEVLDGLQDLKLMTDLGPVDLRSEVNGVGFYEDAIVGAKWLALFGHEFPVLEISKLIVAKRTAGRAKDLIAVAELEAVLSAKANHG
ncbi:MAG TPA: hypothetical protein VGJ55_12345 [Pyrinomonadaceae bacterium]